MQRTYKCRSCGVCFLAEESPNVVCPHCQSDDTELVKESSSMKKIIIVAICAFAIAVGVGVVIGILKKENTTLQTELTDEATNNEIVISSLTYVDEDSTETKQNEQEKIKDLEDTTGVITEPKELPVQPVQENATPQPQPEQVKKLSVQDVQNLINKCVAAANTTPITTAKGVVANVKVDFESVGGETFPPAISTIISAMEMMDVKGYKVVSVDYDDQNKVSHIHLCPLL